MHKTSFPHRCLATDIYSGGPRTITTSHYHSSIGVEVPAWNITNTSWTRDMRRFDNIFTALWVLYQVRRGEVCWPGIWLDSRVR